MAERKDPIPTLGGKSQLINTLTEIFNYCIEEYALIGACDYFMGGNRLFLHLDNNQVRFKLANEIDRGMVAFFRCLQDSYQTDQLIEMIWRLADQINTEEKFKKACELRLLEGTDLVLAGALTYIVTKYSRAANRQFFCKTNAESGIDLASLDKFIGLDEVIGDVQIICGDYKEQFHKYKHREDFLIWLDPPYLITEDNQKGKRRDKQMANNTKETAGYVHPFTRKDHELMVDNLLAPDFRNKVVLSGYQNDVYKRLEQKGFHPYFAGMVHVPSSGTGKKIAEYIWCNFEVPDCLLPVPDSE
ncbi:DNA adenine methylase [Brevibacillus borstelensis]|uniref:DNA adenine methylase n=1 Tax=Brevibacillus borstelensis TaxID=45462 RepID=UPI002E238814|nr:DNA adenine methylase [Brevibacillus borstelensis]MED1746639.1 DNA adenine methylase [Brevibacillus borstelensis]